MLCIKILFIYFPFLVISQLKIKSCKDLLFKHPFSQIKQQTFKIKL